MSVYVRRALSLVLALLLATAVFADDRERDRGPGPDKERGLGNRLPVPAVPPEECLQFSCHSLPSNVTLDNVGQLTEAWRITLPEIADGAPVYVENVETNEGPRDLLIVSTFSGRVVAVNAKSGSIVWMTEPPEGERWT